MVQVRIWNFGDSITHNRLTTVQRELLSPGVFSGYTLTIVDPQTVALSSGYLMFPNGIVLNETASVQYAFPTMPVLPTNYTLVATHVDSAILGGVGATLSLETGFIRKGSVPDGVVLAWIFHPGGAAALADHMIVHPPKERRATQGLPPDRWTSPFSEAQQTPDVHHTIEQVITDLADLQTGTNWPSTQITADGATVSTENTTFRWTEPVKEDLDGLVVPPASVDLQVRLKTGCTVTVNIYDVTGTLVSITTPPPYVLDKWINLHWVVPLGLTTALPNGTWEAGKVWMLEVIFSQPLLTECGFLQATVGYAPTV